VAKLLCTDQEELYKNRMKLWIKVGKDFVTQGTEKEQVCTLTQPHTFNQMYKIAPSGFKFKA
jgi:hypothetical protein